MTAIDVVSPLEGPPAADVQADDPESSTRHTRIYRVRRHQTIGYAAEEEIDAEAWDLGSLVDLLDEQLRLLKEINKDDSALAAYCVGDNPIVVAHQSNSVQAEIETTLTTLLQLADQVRANPATDFAAPVELAVQGSPVAGRRVVMFDTQPLVQRLQATAASNAAANVAPWLRDTMNLRLPQPEPRQQFSLWQDRLYVLLDEPGEESAEVTHASRMLVELAKLLDVLHWPEPNPGARVQPGAELTTNTLNALVETSDPFRRRAAALLLRLVASQQEQINSTALADLLDAITAAQDDFVCAAAVELLAAQLDPSDQELLPQLERLAARVQGEQAGQLVDALGRLGPAAVPLICRVSTGRLVSNGSRALRKAARGDPASVEVILNACLGRPEEDVKAFVDSLGDVDPNYSVTRRFFERPESDIDPAILSQWRELQSRVYLYIGDSPDGP